jgi:polyphosphate glucokinase
VVDVDSGQLVGERLRVETPEPATPIAVAFATADLVAQLGPPVHDVVGIGFPSIVREGVVSTANNIDATWIGLNAVDVFESALGCKVAMANDADAAALAEAEYGKAKGISGTVVVLTFGTGIGSGVLHNGVLLPNIELGMLEFGGVYPAEMKYSAKVRRREDLSWEEWGTRANEFLVHVDRVFSPELMIVGGGVSRKWENYAEYIDSDLPVVRAQMANNAGIIGAATLAR